MENEQRVEVEPNYLLKVAQQLRGAVTDKKTGFVTMWPSSRDALASDLERAASTIARHRTEATRSVGGEKPHLDLTGHIADAVRDAGLSVLGVVISFRDSEIFAERLRKQVEAATAPPRAQDVAGESRAVPTDAQVREAMQTAWDDFCDDAKAIPGDIRRERGKTFFVAGTWADHTAMHLRAALSPPTATASKDVVRLVAELEGLLAKATPGPWYAKEPEPIEGSIYIDDGEDNERPVAMMMSGSPHNQDIIDATLIVAAVNALPTLLAALKGGQRDEEAGE